MKDYHINVFYSDKDECYVADIPDLEYCSAFASTPEKAVREVILAKAEWLKAAKKEGKRIPRPKYRPVVAAPTARKKNRSNAKSDHSTKR